MTKQMILVIVLFVYVLIRSIFIEPNSLEVIKYQIEDNQLQGIRIAFLSDFHLKRRDYSRLDRIIKMTNLQKPDMVLMGGDFAVSNKPSKTMNTDILAQKLSQLEAPSCTVLGESDWKNNAQNIKASLQRKGIKVLENSSTKLPAKRRYVDIVGLDDLETKTPRISKAIRKTGRPRILVTHNPDIYFDVLDDVSVIFAGHTHGGQFVIPFTKPFFVSSKYGSDFASGMIKKTSNYMIISKGLGHKAFPLRLNCKPEITIVDFVRRGQGTGRVVKKRKLLFN